MNGESTAMHTPGPWRLNEDGPIIRVHFSLPDGRESGTAVSIGSTALQFRAPRQGSHRGQKMVYRPFSDEDRADARLIAAAPELLGELRVARDYLDTVVLHRDEDANRCARLIAQFDAAIAKAEGRS